MRVWEIFEELDDSKDLDKYLKWLLNHLKAGGRIDRVMLDHPEDINMFIGNQAVLSPYIIKALKTKFNMTPTDDHFTDDSRDDLVAAKDHSRILADLHQKL